MKKSIYRIVVCFVFILIMIPTFAQNLDHKISKAMKQILKTKDQKVEMNMVISKLGDASSILQKEKMEFINNSNGRYLKVMGTEVIFSDSKGVRIDHDKKRISVFDTQKDQDLEVFSMPEWMTKNTDYIKNNFELNQTVENGIEVFTFIRDAQKEMEMHFEGEYLVKLIQYPKRSIKFNGKAQSTVLQINYTYHKGAHKHTNFSDVFQNEAKLQTPKLSYQEYKVIDIRKK